MSEGTQTFRIIFDNLFRRAERKISGATVELIGTVLRNAGLDEGEWVLKDSHRIKKKGRNRFHAIRVESRSGLKSIRLWCKPRGNDSCFEYSLVPPSEISAENAFEILKRTNPVSLAVSESPSLPGVFLSHVIDIPPTFRPSERVKVFEVEETTQEATESPKEPVLMPNLSEEGVGFKEAVKAFINEPGQYFSMRLDEPCFLSDQEAMDKALIAIAMVADDGYARKNEASESIIKNLDVRNFVANVSGGTYTSLEGAMRALTMALTNRGNYIQKINYSSSSAVRGYKLTVKGCKRIETLKKKYSISLSENSAGSDPIVKDSGELNQPELSKPDCPNELGVFDSDALGRLEILISECRGAENQIKEIESVISNIDSEIASLQIDVGALDLAEKERVRQIEEISKEIDMIRSKKIPIIQKIKQKTSDKEEWQREKVPLVAKKSEAEEEIFKFTGRRRQS